MKKIAVLIIDAQNDFCDPSGSLFVEGAVEDNQRLSKWINDNKKELVLLMHTRFTSIS